MSQPERFSKSYDIHRRLWSRVHEDSVYADEMELPEDELNKLVQGRFNFGFYILGGVRWE